MTYWDGYEVSDHCVYHYMSLHSALLILSSGRLRFSDLRDVNDPVEQRKRVAFYGPTCPKDGKFKNAAKQAVTLLNNTFVLCCSRDPNSHEHGDLLNSMAETEGTVVPFHSQHEDRGFYRMRMWAQYAANHSGVCLVLNRERLNETTTALATAESFKFYSGPVRYGAIENCKSSDPFLLSWEEVTEHGIKSVVDSHVERNHVAEFFFKRLDWRDEREYRWVLCDVNDGPVYVSVKDALCAVILGNRFNPECELSIQKLVSPSVTILRFSPTLRLPLDVVDTSQ